MTISHSYPHNPENCAGCIAERILTSSRKMNILDESISLFDTERPNADAIGIAHKTDLKGERLKEDLWRIEDFMWKTHTIYSYGNLTSFIRDQINKACRERIEIQCRLNKEKESRDWQEEMEVRAKQMKKETTNLGHGEDCSCFQCADLRAKKREKVEQEAKKQSESILKKYSDCQEISKTKEETDTKKQAEDLKKKSSIKWAPHEGGCNCFVCEGLREKEKRNWQEEVDGHGENCNCLQCVDLRAYKQEREDKEKSVLKKYSDHMGKIEEITSKATWLNAKEISKEEFVAEYVSKWSVITMDEYQQKARETAVYPLTFAIYYPALGLAGEAGEVANKVKKIIRDGANAFPKLKEQLKDEMGDVLWYLSTLAGDLGFTLDEIAQFNLNKLKKRKDNNTLKQENPLFRESEHDQMKKMEL